MGLMALLGRHAPASLKLLLTTIAVVDDMGAVAIIALAYTAKLNLLALGGAGIALAWMYVCNRARREAAAALSGAGGGAVAAGLRIGRTPTIAGVAAALMIPREAAHRLAHMLNPWVAFAIVPLFGFANAGVALPGWEALLAPLPLAIALGLFARQAAGCFRQHLAGGEDGAGAEAGGALGADLRDGAACGHRLHDEPVHWRARIPDGPLTDQVKIGVLAGSVLSALAGYLVLRSTSTATNSTANPPSESSAPTQPVDVQP
jgi:NhaA family Na+:H+ antiporter